MNEPDNAPLRLPIPDRPLLRGEKVWPRPLEERDLPAFAFNAVGLNRVWLTVYASSARAIRSHEKLSFRHEGLVRQSRRRPNGLEASALMAILRDEWQQANEPG